MYMEMILIWFSKTKYPFSMFNKVICFWLVNKINGVNMLKLESHIVWCVQQSAFHLLVWHYPFIYLSELYGHFRWHLFHIYNSCKFCFLCKFIQCQKTFSEFKENSKLYTVCYQRIVLVLFICSYSCPLFEKQPSNNILCLLDGFAKTTVDHNNYKKKTFLW